MAPNAFLDPVPNEIGGEGADPAEKFLPSVLEDVEKAAHGIPFSSSPQTEKTVEFTLVFVRENISCSSKIELPYFSVEAYPI